MQNMKRVITLVVFFYPLTLFAQTTYLPEGSKEYHIIDRLEIKEGKNTQLNFSTLKPYSRKSVVEEAEYIDSVNKQPGSKSHLNSVDEYDLHSLLMDNSEWVSGSKESFLSKKSLWNTFYTTKPNLLEVNTKDFFLALNPVLDLQVGGESGNSESLYYNKRGVTLRGRIANKIGFSTTITDNQERGPSFFENRVAEFNAVPGVGFYKKFKINGFDYFDGRGYMTFNITKYIDVQFGYDKNFLGNGYRSLFLSDFGNSYLFLKLNTKIWKFDYENLFMELMPLYTKTGDNLLDRKYAAMHHLSMNIGKSLNVGLFEGVIFGRKNRFDFEYLNPVIFLRHVEGTLGSPDNAVAGIDFKANAAHHFQFYGQLLLDEFHANEIAKNDGYWANKYGYQLGVKYIDAFTIKNLDLQLESNRVRPFTYSHNDSIADYTHYNQPLAHPLGANFQEWVGVLKYQPVPKWYVDARAIYYKQGLDTLGLDYGANPFESYVSRFKDFGYFIGDGRTVQCFNASFTLSYELKENLFIDGNLLFRKYTSLPTSSIFNIGIRWNAARRDYDY